MKKLIYFIIGLCLASGIAYGADPTFFRDMLVSSSIKVGGTSVADSKSAIEINSTTKGFLTARMTTTQQNAISSPPTGLSLYDTTLNLFALYNGTSWLNMATTADAIVGLAGARQYIANPGAETGTGGWATYADAAATTPVNGTGGSASATWTQSSSFPLVGQNSFLLTKGGTNRQGDGASYDFAVDSSQVAKVMQIEFDYLVSSGTFVAGTSTTDSDVTVWVYDVTNSVLISPSTSRLYSNSATISGRYIANFQTNSGSTNYRLIFHVGSTSASAYTLKFDNITVKPSVYVYGTPITDWVSFTPANGSWLANSPVYTGMWRRVGDSMEMIERVTAGGAVTNVALTMKIPTGYTIDTAKLQAAVAGYAPLLGEAVAVDSGGSLFPGFVVYNDTTSVYIYIGGSASTYVNAANLSATVPITFGSPDYVEIKVRVPIVGWSSNVQMSDQGDQRIVALMLTGSTTSVSSSGAAITPTTVTKDTHGAFATATYTVPVPGYYQIEGRLVGPTTGSYVAGDFVQIGYKVNGGTEVALGFHRISATTNTNYGTQGAALAFLSAGDTVQFFGTSSATGNLNNFAGSIFKLGGPTAIGATETIAARYTNTAGTSITNTLAETNLPFATKDYDTHLGYSGTVYTVQTPGKYRVAATFSYASSAWTAGNSAYAIIYKNGSAYAYGPYFMAQVTASYLVGQSVYSEVPAVSGDTIEIRAANNRTGGATLLSTTAGLNHFEIGRIGL